MSKKIWDFCKSCGKELPESNEIEEKFRDCKSCQAINFLIKVSILIIVILIIYLGFFYKTNNWLSLIGLCFDILGAYLLATGYVEVMVQAASGWDSFETILKFKKRHSYRIWAGLGLLTIGFFLQAINTVIVK